MKTTHKIIHNLPNGDLLIEYPELNQGVLIGRPNPRMEGPLTAAILTDLAEVKRYAKGYGKIPHLKWHQLVHLSQ